MYINITFPNKDMLNAFIKSFRKKGYKDKDYKIIDNTFCFYYKKPKTRKVWTRGIISDFIRQSINKNNVRLYNKYLEDYIDYSDSSIKEDKLIIVNELIPEILKNKEDKKIKNEISNYQSNNVVLLHNDIYSSLGVNKNDQNIR